MVKDVMRVDLRTRHQDREDCQKKEERHDGDRGPDPSAVRRVVQQLHLKRIAGSDPRNRSRQQSRCHSTAQEEIDIEPMGVRFGAPAFEFVSDLRQEFGVTAHKSRQFQMARQMQAGSACDLAFLYFFFPAWRFSVLQARAEVHPPRWPPRPVRLNNVPPAQPDN